MKSKFKKIFDRVKGVLGDVSKNKLLAGLVLGAVALLALIVIYKSVLGGLGLLFSVFGVAAVEGERSRKIHESNQILHKKLEEIDRKERRDIERELRKTQAIPAKDLKAMLDQELKNR